MLAAERGAVRLTKDDWIWALGSDPWNREFGERIEAQLWTLAREILVNGMSVVLDFGLWARAERDDLRAAARSLGVGAELHYLAVSPDALWRRIEARNSTPQWNSATIRRADLDRWQTVFEAPNPEEMVLFDQPTNW